MVFNQTQWVKSRKMRICKTIFLFKFIAIIIPYDVFEEFELFDI